MAIKWTYDEASANEATFAPLPEGIYPATISEAEEKTSSKGLPMIKMTLDVESGKGKPRKVFHYVTFLPENPGVTNRNLRDIRDSFRIDAKHITDGNVVPFKWMGAKGMVELIIDEYNGKKNNKVKSFVANQTDAGTEFAVAANDDIPF